MIDVEEERAVRMLSDAGLVPGCGTDAEPG